MSDQNGHSPPVVPPRVTILNEFRWEVEEFPDGRGGRQLKLQTPNGELIVVPFSPERAVEVGHALIALGVETPGGPLPSSARCYSALIALRAECRPTTCARHVVPPAGNEYIQFGLHAESWLLICPGQRQFP